jgi:hypothetical protein
MKLPAGHTLLLTIALLILPCLVSCEEKGTSVPEPAKPTAEKGCRQCHDFTPDPGHDFQCATCHLGDPEATVKEQAHQGLVANPAGPENMEHYCGGCHEALVKSAAASLHFTLKNETNLVRAAFGAREPLSSLTEIPIHEAVESPLQLADDLLRRRCLRCHPYTEGDPYPATRRGTGCAACHLPYRDGRLVSHRFLKTPTDNECLHCHYGNYVGADYYGRYEHDFSLEYRTPYRTDEVDPRPYGVEFHQLQPDIHQTAGMGCIDCHTGSRLMGGPHRRQGSGPAGEHTLSCRTCHQEEPGLGKNLPANLAMENGRLFLTTRLSGRRLPVPALRHPAHFNAGQQADCLVCHAQWTYFDRGTHLLRQDFVDYEEWWHLSVQGAFEVEDQLDLSDYDFPLMRDKINGKDYLGIWFKAFELRRWEAPIIGRDLDGTLKIFRPILDLHLSFVNADGKVVFDNVGIVDQVSAYQPYTPHTVGKAGAFYHHRLTVNLEGAGKKP